MTEILQEICGICGEKNQTGKKMIPYRIPVPTGDCYLTRKVLLCDKCREVIEEMTKKKIIEIGIAIEERRKLFRDAARQKRNKP